MMLKGEFVKSAFFGEFVKSAFFGDDRGNEYDNIFV